MLINLRNALMGGKWLPYDAEVEYLQSSGTQYIKSGLTVASGMRVVGDFDIQGVGWIFGGRSLSGSNQFNLYQYDTSAIRAAYGTSSVNISSVSLGRHTLDFDNNVFKIDGTIKQTFTAQTFSATSPLYIGTLSADNSGTAATSMFKGKIYSVQIYQNGVLVRDFIPVRKGTVGYLYDRVSGKLFGNEGSGDFVLGPDVVPVEYIESHGTEWIDTGVLATGATNSELQFKMSVAGFAFGARTAWNASAYSLNYATGKYAFNYGNNSVVADLKTNIRIDTNWHTAKIKSGGVLSLDEWTGTAGTFSFTTNGSLILFGTRQGSLLNLTASGFKYCKIWDNSLPVRSFRPVRVGTDATSWEGAMMDVLTRRIYRNAGTGAFTYGNDLKYPIPAS